MKTVNKTVLVVGGGIAGIQASIDLANMGFPVYLVEKSPSIGGRMAQLDKTFPTNDCSMCILAPKMIEVAQHPNVKLLSYSEIESVSGEVGSFTAKIKKKARSVIEDKCTGCGTCTEKCPWKTDSEFNAGTGQRRAIYTPFPQAIPNVAVIDRETCVYFLKGTCKACERFCEAKAIDFEQTDQFTDIDIGAIILATGLDPYPLTSLGEYQYGKIKDVITALEFERLICASGPTNGELVRPSDGKTPERLAFIQCVGSRDFKNKAYCSAVCCMHATKEAILANEHHPETKSSIFYMDLRAVGKGFQEYVSRASSEYNVTYIRSRPGNITVDQESNNPVIWYEDTTTGETKNMEVELVVLCQALIPSQGTQEAAGNLGVGLDEYGFIDVPDKFVLPVDTGKPGIFVCGYAHSPRDIPDSIIQASATAARVAEVLSGGS